MLWNFAGIFLFILTSASGAKVGVSVRFKRSEERHKQEFLSDTTARRYLGAVLQRRQCYNGHRWSCGHRQRHGSVQRRTSVSLLSTTACEQRGSGSFIFTLSFAFVFKKKPETMTHAHICDVTACTPKKKRRVLSRTQTGSFPLQTITSCHQSYDRIFKLTEDGNTVGPVKLGDRFNCDPGSYVKGIVGHYDNGNRL